MCVCMCVCVGRIWCTGYLHNNQVCTFMHMYVLCENSDNVRNKNPKSLQVLCVCARIHSCTCTLCKNSASSTSPVCVSACACVFVCVCVCVCDKNGVRAIYITMQGCVVTHVHAL